MSEELDYNPLIFLDQTVVGILKALMDKGIFTKEDLTKIHDEAKSKAVAKKIG